MLGLSKSTRTSPLEKALSIPPIRPTVALSCFKVLKSCLLSPSKAASFYNSAFRHSFTCSDLVKRCTCTEYARLLNLNFLKFFYKYAHLICSSIKSPHEDDGFIDSVRFVLFENNFSGAKDFLQLLVNAF